MKTQTRKDPTPLRTAPGPAERLLVRDKSLRTCIPGVPGFAAPGESGSCDREPHIVRGED
ncbi:hypothetical protein [Streptomyces sp. NBC_01304]|uniref:hypothetical protein n=1 Tax=Streptomyces sp. NBC_01304 TaxID=2903818 RepID=UPI002E138DF5|nr:hypothetical protein OG430_09380 [Streptomyces sp. NBC_01304]